MLLGARHDVDDAQLVFNLGSDQLRAGPLWLSSAADVQLVDAPQSTFWLLGHYEG